MIAAAELLNMTDNKERAAAVFRVAVMNVVLKLRDLILIQSEAHHIYQQLDNHSGCLTPEVLPPLRHATRCCAMQSTFMVAYVLRLRPKKKIPGLNPAELGATPKSFYIW